MFTMRRLGRRWNSTHEKRGRWLYNYIPSTWKLSKWWSSSAIKRISRPGPMDFIFEISGVTAGGSKSLVSMCTRRCNMCISLGRLWAIYQWGVHVETHFKYLGKWVPHLQGYLDMGNAFANIWVALRPRTT